MIKKNIFLSLFIFFSPILMVAQTVRISGNIYDTKKNVLSGVSIVQEGNNNGVISNSKGTYSLGILPKKDSIKLLYSYVGYHTLEVMMPSPTTDLELNIILTEEEKELGPVVVNARKPRTVNLTMDIYDTKQRSYLLDSSIESLLSSFSGVSSTNELSSQYLVRGGNFDENLIYVNGIEIYRPLLVRSGQQEGLSFINPNMVQTVGFSSGGYDAKYGDRMSSVLDIVYKKPSHFEGSVGASLMDGSLYVGNSSKRFSQMTSIRYKQNQSLLSTSDTKAEYDPSFLDFQTYITYTLSPKWEASFLGNYSRNIYQFTPQSRSTSFGTLYNVRNYNVYFDGWEDDKFLTSQAALTLKGKLSENVELGFTGSVFSSDEQERYDIGGQYRLTELLPGSAGDENLLGVGTYHEHARNKLDVDVYNMTHFGSVRLNKHLLNWGISYQKQHIKDKIKEWEMRDSTGYLLPSNGEAVNVYSSLISNNKLNSNRISAYLQDRYQFSTNVGLFTLNAGIRGSYWDYNEELLISPRISLFFIPSANENVTFRFATGLYYQAPFYKEYQQIVNVNGNNTVVPNINIKSQRSEHYVLGGDYYFKGGEQSFKFSTELYYKRLHDIIPYTVNNVKIRYSGENEGKGYIAGIDMRLYGEFVPETSSWISFSLMKTQQDINGVKMPLPTDQQYNISIYYQDYFPNYKRLKMSLKGSVTQGLPTSAPHQTFANGYFRSPAYKRMDLGFTWEILGENYSIRKTNSFCKAFKNIWLGLDVLNLFDFKNVNTYYWVADVNNNQYAVPNYLTGRQLNLRLLADF